MTSAFFFGTVITIYLLINAYMLARLSSMLKGAGFLRLLACAVFCLFAASFPASRAVSGIFPAAADFLFILGSLYLAPMIHGFLLTVAADLLRLLNYHVALTSNPPPYSQNRRENTVAVILLFSLALSFAGGVNASFPVAREIGIQLGGEYGYRPPVRIALVSDLHLGKIRSLARLERITNLIKSKNPDIVLIAGDTVDDAAWLRSSARRNETAALMSSLRPRLGVWAVPGNHDYYAGIEESNGFLRSCGIRVLMDEWAVPGGEFILIGRDDRTVMRSGRERAALGAIIARAKLATGEEPARLPIVVLDHQPVRLEEAQDAGAALQLSGHTHKGQIFPANLVVSAIFEKYYGPYRKGETYYYITSGAGTWGPPVRTTGRPEVVFIDLERDPRLARLRHHCFTLASLAVLSVL